MSWQQLHCLTNKLDSEALSTLLEESGAVSVTYQDAEDMPVLEPLPGETRLWDNILLTALYPATEELTNTIALIETTFPKTQNIEVTVLEEQQWERAWMDNFHPMQFGKSLWIYPSGYERPDDGSTQILLDPGLAFGTGTHPTTSLCLQWLDQHPPKESTAIDYGCGSGILAIAAIKLGATHVQATDIDEQALIATVENMKTNHIAADSITTCFPEAMQGYKQVDLVLANILSGPLAELAPILAAFTKPQGHIVLSGILENQEQQIRDAYTPFFSELECVNLDGWLRVSGIRNI